MSSAFKARPKRRDSDDRHQHTVECSNSAELHPYRMRVRGAGFQVDTGIWQAASRTFQIRISEKGGRNLYIPLDVGPSESMIRTGVIGYLCWDSGSLSLGGLGNSVRT